MRTAEYRLSQVRVGLFVAICGIILTASILYFGMVGSPFSRPALIHADFDNVYGLAEGSTVEMGGVSVGQIEKLGLPNLNTGLVPVTLSIRREALSRLGPSSRAFTSSHALVGQRFVGLSVRQEDEPQLQDGGTLETRPSDALDTVMAQAQRTMNQVNGLIQQAQNVMSTFSRVANEIEAGHGTLGRLVRDDALYDSLADTAANAKKLSGEMARGKGALAALVNDPALGDQLRETVGTLAESARRIREGHGVVGKLVNDDQAAARIDRTLANLDSVTSRLTEAKGTLGALISDPTVLEKMNGLLNEADSLLTDMRRNPQRYLKITAF